MSGKTWNFSCVVAIVLSIFTLIATGHPTLYAKNDQDKFSAVLQPVSSTVIPLPIYKVSYSLDAGASDDVPTNWDSERRLITAKTRKNKKATAKVKPLSREQFEKPRA